ncbi:hypothetical protein F3I62_18865 [Pseudomonas sp. R-28-1W-6]|uniref:hypothetical protein n=1 Tax=Pseudomonas sp. R-28-1W-6 TaxID=2650101 RepID=UPI00136624C9|nr:hypothetical protein [Pseudomonas sp. R-28-1W-6]MWV14167.1 hypothetical protein [Pseudomonas sp. R-28-1W-6]
MTIERVGKAIAASLMAVLVLAAVVIQGLNPCGAELSPCPVQPETGLGQVSK